MTLLVKAQLDAMMNGAFAAHPFSYPQFRHQINRSLFEDTGANGRFNLFSTPAFEDNRIDPFPGKKEREEQASRSCPDDSNTCSHVHHIHNASPRKLFPLTIHRKPKSSYFTS